MFDPGGARPTAGGAAALARLDELVAAATSLGDVVAGCGGWSGGQRSGALRRLDRLAGALATVRSGLLVAEQRSQGSVGPGDRDFIATRARMTRTGLGEARREVRQAETLTALPAVADAVGDGRVPLPHLDALARVTATAGDRATTELARPETQARLVRMAEQQSAREFGASAARLVASFDPETLERTVEAQRRERFLVLSRQPDGTHLKGRLDHLSAEVLRTAIAAAGQAPDGDRTKAQADADALVAVAERAIAGTAGVRARRTSPGGQLLPDAAQDAADARVSGVSNRPTVSVLVPVETFAELRAAQQRREAGDEGGWRPVEPAVLEDGTPLAMSQLARMLCDSEVGRIVMSADGVPLDLGRTERLYTGQQRRAVIVRDRQCAWNGCDVPAAYCEVHHIRWWDRHQGRTSVENGVLLCSHHHHVVHQLDLDIVRLSRPPSRGPMLGDPARYRFATRGGRCVSAPPGRAAPPGDAAQPGVCTPPGGGGPPREVALVGVDVPPGDGSPADTLFEDPPAHRAADLVRGRA
ncbi:DUF222 domain-containing protein [Isoptericola sp. b441]|uniref:DUF222 domain-containing protein n=1 Tax=Actinotalea lenta TaxID=3064654 RepID=A0ABT9D829_9CELL|nr:HNH endonuclease signature motif containing protein [Isoptericola sp. b441]MDO8107027.1 DUF222 domain-containing protein [Isoptericola sp. b441]